MRNEIMVYGDLAMDILMRSDSHPGVGQDVRVEDIIFNPGGSAANCAAVAARLGIPTTFIGCVGSDHYGRMVRSDLRKNGVSTRWVSSVNGKTGITVGVVEPGGERTFFSYRGVNSGCEPGPMPVSMLKRSRYLHLTGYSYQEEKSAAYTSRLIELSKQSGMLVSLDPSHLFAVELENQHPDLLSKTDILFPNREEARFMSGSKDPVKAASELLQRGPKIVAIKLGLEGCYVASREQTHHLPAVVDARVVDTTGAGDAFCAGFLFGQIFGLDIRESALIANHVSAAVISQFGGHTNAPTINELISLLLNSNEVTLAVKISGMVPERNQDKNESKPI